MYIVSAQHTAKPHYCTTKDIAELVSYDLKDRYNTTLTISFDAKKVQYVFTQKQYKALQDCFILISVGYSSDPILLSLSLKEAKILLQEIEKAKQNSKGGYYYKIHSLDSCFCITKSQFNSLEEYLKKSILVS